ncbi:MAG: NPCBM/NEW2 domain-containing protein [Oscillospiraceae bacterium]|nr:NPCBM/NEW2 domain-containing protein [Oscillospiraceae bacterium]
MQRSNKAKYVILGMLLMAMFSSIINPALASATYRQITVMYDNIKVVANGKLIEKDGAGNAVTPFMVGGVTYVPARVLGEAFCNGVTSWDAETNTLYLGPKVLPQTKLTDLTPLRTGGSNLRSRSEARDDTNTFRNDCLTTTMQNYNPESTVDYSLSKAFTRISGVFFLSYGSRQTTRDVQLRMWGDGRLLYTSGVLTGSTMLGGGNPIHFDVNVSGVDELKIAVFEVNGRTEGATVGFSATLHQ